MQTELMVNSLRGAVRMLTIPRPSTVGQREPRLRRLRSREPDKVARVVRVPTGYGAPDLEKRLGSGLAEWGLLDNLRALGRRCLMVGNFNSADPYPASSDPELLWGLASLLRNEGFELTLAASAGIPWMPTCDVLHKLGIARAAKNRGIELWITDESESWVEVETPLNNWTILIPERMFNFDTIIYVPLVRTHRFAGFSQGMKLSMAIVHPWTRRQVHLAQLEEKIVAMNAALQPDLIIADLRQGFATGGPEAGRTVEPGLLLFGSHPVTMEIQGMKELARAATAEGLRLSVNPEEARTIQAARRFGVSKVGSGEFEVVEVE